ENGSTETSALITVTEKQEPGPTPIKPVAKFEVDKTEGEAPLNVQFTDKSTGAPTAWEWNFGDKVSSKEQNPFHTYTTPGTYEATLTINGSTASTKIQVFEPKSPTKADPKAIFVLSPEEGYAPLTVEFTDMSKNAKKWNWDFGDGNTSTERSPVHIYTKTGRFTVSLIVSNENGENSVLETVIVKAEKAEEEKPSSSGHKSCGGMTYTPPVPVKDKKVCPDEQTTVPPLTSQESKTAKVCPTRQTTTPDKKVRPVTKKTGVSICKTAPKIIINENGKTERLSIGIIDIIQNIKIDEKNSAGHHSGARLRILPKIGFNASIIQKDDQGLSIQFDSKCSRDVSGWYWNFGDGAKSIEQNPSHTYTAPGRYTVSLVVVTGDGYIKLTKIDYIYVKNMQPN
ncbi:MAG: PKD domain-containing protein, partial [Patescibacteria group bacterium]